LAADAVLGEPVSGLKFPVIREFNREIRDFGLLLPVSASDRCENSLGYRQIPYAAEQGIFNRLTGKMILRTGSL
jgi:hypothetical protein